MNTPPRALLSPTHQHRGAGSSGLGTELPQPVLCLSSGRQRSSFPLGPGPPSLQWPPVQAALADSTGNCGRCGPATAVVLGFFPFLSGGIYVVGEETACGEAGTCLSLDCDHVKRPWCREKAPHRSGLWAEAVTEHDLVWDPGWPTG